MDSTPGRSGTVRVPSGGVGPIAPPAAPELEWAADPIDFAVAGMRQDPNGRAWPDRLPPSFCSEAGRRVLLAELEFGSWVLRRVETVSMESGRSVARKMSIEFKIRDDAPTFVPDDEGGSAESYWLVPVAIMNRRTLVDFHITNEDGSPLTLPGLRLTQQLDEAILMAAAAAAGPPDDAVQEFVRDVVAGDRGVVTDAMDRYDADAWSPTVTKLRKDPLFSAVLERLRYNFTLYVLLPRSRGRHRLLHMSFVEPVRWRYQLGKVKKLEPGKWDYQTNVPAPRKPGHLASRLGLTPTRIRFQTPSAENATSYHMEFEAPEGVRIVGATLLAGRPHVDDRRRTVDPVRGDSLTVGLHAIEVPPNSLCRAQVSLRVQTAGWLTTLLIAALAIFAVLASVAWHAFTQDSPTAEQTINVVLLLITSTAAAATFVAQRDFGGVAARLVSGMRAVGALIIALPLVMALFLSYEEEAAAGGVESSTRWASLVLTGLAAALSALVAITWVRTYLDERRDAVTSPWDMSYQAKPSMDDESEDQNLSFRELVKKYGFHLPAVSVRSSEGWHHSYWWTDDNHRSAVDRLTRLAGPAREELGYACSAGPRACPHAIAGRCAIRVAVGAGNVAQE